MSATTLTLLGVFIIVACAVASLSKKFPTWVPFAVIPPVVALIAGFAAGDVSGWIHKAAQGAVMAALNCLFAVVFFVMLNKTGMFDIIIKKLLSLVKGNVYIVYLIAMALGAIGQLSASSMTAILIAVPAMYPLFKQLHLDPKKMLLTICMGAMPINMLPWGTPTSLAAYSPEMDPGVMTRYTMPVMIFTYVLYVLVVLWFAKRDYAKNKEYIDSIKSEITASSDAKVDFSEKPLARPKLFFVNLGIMLLALVGCICLTSVRSYIIFAVAAALVGVINYKPGEVGGIVNEVGNSQLGAITLIFSIAFMTGVLNNSGMLASLADAIINAVPDGLLRFFPAFWAWARPILDCFIPYEAWNTIPPLLVSVGSGLGMSAYQVLCCTSIMCIGGVPCSPLIPPVLVGCRLAEIDIMDNLKHSLPICAVLNAIVMIFALVVGIA